MRNSIKEGDCAPWLKLIYERRNRLDGQSRTLDNESVGNKKMRRIFLSGMLLGVMVTATFTFVFAIPANSDHWRWEIWNRGGAAWTFDKNGHRSWKWIVEPLRDAPPKKPVSVPLSQTNVKTEQL